jgi:hypothetical protein
MLLQGHPLPETLLSQAPGADRFWYWHGASGRKYIHSIYAVGRCPPVPGAIFVAVRRQGNERRAVAVRRFPAIWEDAFATFLSRNADEVHVHLLARDQADAESILSDLRAAFDADSKPQLTLAA